MVVILFRESVAIDAGLKSISFLFISHISFKTNEKYIVQEMLS